MKGFLLALAILPLPSLATTYSCGMYEVDIQPLRFLVADGELTQYSHSTLDKNMNLINTYQNKERSMLTRETPKGRLAFRVVGDFGWKSCVAVEPSEVK
jgi:hypothetical protein